MIDYEDYILEISGITEEVRRNDSTFLNSDIHIKFRNDRFKDKDFLVLMGSTYPFAGAEIVIKECLLDEDGLALAPDVIFKGTLDQPENITPMEFTCNVSTKLFSLSRQWKQPIITKELFANAVEDLGKYIPIIYGADVRLPAPRVDWGVKTTLKDTIDATQTTGIILSDPDSRMPSSGTVIIDDENIAYTSYSSRTLGGVTRGADSTTAVPHAAGADVCEKKTNYDSVLANHPLYAVGDIFAEINDQLFRVTTGVSAIESGGRTLLRATAIIKVNSVSIEGVSLSDTIDVTTGLHDHGTLETINDFIPDNASHTTEGTWVGNDNNVYDQSDVTSLKGTMTGLKDDTITVEWPVYEGPRPTKVYVMLTHKSSKTGAGVLDFVKITSPDEIVMDTSDVKVEQTFLVTGGVPTSIVITISSAAGNTTVCELFEASLRVHAVTTNPSPATGVTKNGTVTLNGEQQPIGTYMVDRFHATCSGYKDDGSGTYTGTGDALITSPEAVMKHWLMVQLGFPAGDVDSAASFALAKIAYAAAVSGGYKLAFAIVDEIEPGEWLKLMAFESRSNIRYRAGKWYLNYIPDTAPASLGTIDRKDIAEKYGSFVFNETELIELVNDVTIKAKRDYSYLKNESEWLLTSSGTNSTSITKHGLHPQKPELELQCVRTQLIADCFRDWFLLSRANPLLIVKFPIFWENFLYGIGDTFDITNELPDGRFLYDSKIFYIESFERSGEGFDAMVKALEWY